MKYLVLIILSFVSLTSFAQAEEDWLVSMDEAKIEARENNRLILVSFTGSDWCGNCMRLSKDLFETEEFITFSMENLVLLNLDFPAKKANKLSDEQSAHNENLAEKYNKKGTFPLTILINASGKVVGQLPYSPSSSLDTYMTYLESVIN